MNSSAWPVNGVTYTYYDYPAMKSEHFPFSFFQSTPQFSIIAENGSLATNRSINYEAPELVEFRYKVNVTITAGSYSDMCVINVQVQDVNDAPVFPNSTRSVPENSQFLDTVGSALAAEK